MVNKRMIKNGIYRHFKGIKYQLLDIVIHSETKEDMVLYKCLEGDNINKIYVRPADMFFSEVDHKKYPEIKQKYRFEIIEQETKNRNKIKCKIICNQNYGGKKSTIDADFINSELLYEIIKRFTNEDNILYITEAVVDFYNINRQKKDNKISFKTAKALKRNIMKIL